MHSLKFRLVVWYAALLAAAFLILGAAAYVALRGYLVGALRSSLERRAHQIGQLVLQESRDNGEAAVGAEVEARYAPGLNERFVRVSRRDGQVLYTSQTPPTQSFIVGKLPPPVWPSLNDSSREIDLGAGRHLLVACHFVDVPGGSLYLIEAGSPMDYVTADLRQWLRLLLWTLAGVVLLAHGGGYFLVDRALRPVDQIAASAERISSHNLSERLPAPKTGDELERLSMALNHMIERLEE
ncbi:MAG TPA: HAMP domain-containing protein, partial [Verrucomicrobiae bacterium]|nr:HAMP domain-containing protein [Verrucomicrobiae bacterium]